MCRLLPRPFNLSVPLRLRKNPFTQEEAKLKAAATKFFVSSPAPDAEFSPALNTLLLKNEPAVRHAVWEAFVNAPIHEALKKSFDENKVRSEDHVSPYTVKTVGTRPAKGWALFIAMHGGGGAPQELNDSQWRHMQIYYRDHPEVGGYRYIALRAPNNEWNGFYTGYVYPLIANLIQQFLLFADVDPDKIFFSWAIPTADMALLLAKNAGSLCRRSRERRRPGRRRFSLNLTQYSYSLAWSGKRTCLWPH